MVEKKPRSSSLADEDVAIGAAKAAARPQLHSESSNPNMNGPLYMQTFGSGRVLVRRLKRKEEGTWKQVARWFVENQIGLSFNLLALLFLSHAFIPKARPYTSKFFHLCYYNPATGQYGHGFDDFYFITFCIVLLTGLRAATMEYALAPLAKACGAGDKRKDLTRFSEQGWLIVFYTVFWPLGMYIYCNSPYYLNFQGLWTDWPTRELSQIMKGYILAQWAFWLQQIIVINIEEKRKDHWQMFTHHILTVGLISSCYAYHFTRIGNCILVIMDVVDIVLSLAKCLKYCGFTTVCDVLFGFFLLTWFVARHVLHIMTVWSVYTDARDLIPPACWHGDAQNVTGPFDAPAGYWYMIEPFIKPNGIVCFTEPVRWSFIVPLVGLQILMVVWFTMAIRVAVKVVCGGSAEDVRSDAEDEDENETDEFIYEEAAPLEQEVGVEEIDLKNWERRSGVRRQGSSSGVSIHGHSDRKELLGRIGCEKQVD
ncbi:hypothetical protein NLU13_3903 [Sarocladium strictum]|uniref:TLC domain-containing protein n=1 Tax=Sarocladium strictum TaxID=5046 RepID=A0AA39GJ96_SARSR|nr:hypothetical protein NLU13_3903 [Sarocladium strictum]